jgi:dienelactone hydrolase
MGKPLSLTAADAHKLGAYRADPAGQSRGGVVVVQEIFGVNHHIRSVCDRLAALGYSAPPCVSTAARSSNTPTPSRAARPRCISATGTPASR